MHFSCAIFGKDALPWIDIGGVRDFFPLSRSRGQGAFRRWLGTQFCLHLRSFWLKAAES